MKWYHECAPQWLEARKDVITATELIGLAPKWLKSIGGVEAIYEINQIKAQTLYDEIDRNSLFVGTAQKEDRSIMNVCFVMAPSYEHLQDEFLTFAKSHGMVGIKGHRSVGGFRASIYNACSQEDVQALVDCMREFEQLHK